MAKLDVLYQFDENYAPFAGVSLTSLLKNNTNIDELTIYLAAKDISEENIQKLACLAQQYGRQFVYLNVDNIYQTLDSFGAKGWNGSMATWMKMFVSEQIPDTVDKLLYVDSDTLISNSLIELAEVEMGDHPVGAVIDSITTKSYERLDLSSPYYNAGVILFNMKYWREHRTQEKMSVHLENNIQRYPINDQDLLNDFFREDILKLSPKYNFQGIHSVYKDAVYFSGVKRPGGRYYTLAEVEKAREEVCITHFFRFCGQYPWEKGNIHPCKDAYEKALANSLWVNHEAQSHPIKLIYRLEKILYKLLPQKLFLKLHLMVSN